MKKILSLLALTTLTIGLLGSCTKEDSQSLEGRWNVWRGADNPQDYTFSLIFKGNKLDVYIIAWGVHVEGTYTYANDEVTYNITKAQHALSGVTFNEKGEMESWSWMAGDMDKDTFELAPGYDWYPLPKDNPSYPGDMLSKFKFKLLTATTAEVELMGEIAHKVK